MTSSPPLVSFAVPAYNHAPYIVECLDKIVEEPYPAKELIVIDDGSTDATAERIRAWIAQHPLPYRVEFVSRRNRGLAATLNELIGMCRGRYLRSCSSDDYLLPGTVGPMVDVLEKNPNKRMVFGDAVVIDEAGKRIKDSAIFELYHGRRENYHSDEGLLEEVIQRWSLAGPVQLIRLDLYREIGGYDESLKIEDWDMMLRMVARNYAIYLDRPVAAYRVHGANSFKTLYEADRLRHEVEYAAVLEKNHRLFRGTARRQLDFLLFRQRAIVAAMRRGRPPTRRQFRWIRRAAWVQMAFAHLGRLLRES